MTSWKIDPAHSTIEFAVKHMMFTTVKGNFTGAQGTLEFDASNPTAARVEAEVPVSSVFTRDEQRDGHLRSPDFFDAELHPTIRFVSNRVEVTGDNTGKVYGDLTIRGVTQPVVFDAEYGGEGKNPWGVEVMGLTATTKVNRKDFGLNWNVALEAGGVLVGDQVTITLDVQAQKVTEQVGEAATA